MKPYPPLGLLYLTAFLKTRGYSIDIFDSTFAERTNYRTVRERVGHRRHLYHADDAPLGARDRPRGQALRMVRDLGRPRERELHGRVPRGRPRCDRDRRGRGHVVGAASRARALRRASTPDVPGVAFRDEAGAIVHTHERANEGSRRAPSARSRRHRPPLVPRRVEDAPRRKQHQSDHGARLPVSVQLVLARRVRLHASPAQPRRRCRRDANRSSIVTIQTRSGTATTSSLISHPWLAEYGVGSTPRDSQAVRDDHASRQAPKRGGSRAAAQARLLPHLDRLGERQPEDSRRNGAWRDRRAGAAFHEARASARHSGRHVLDGGATRARRSRTSLQPWSTSSGAIRMSF